MLETIFELDLTKSTIAYPGKLRVDEDLEGQIDRYEVTVSEGRHHAASVWLTAADANELVIKLGRSLYGPKWRPFGAHPAG